jgi:hypothetical protein
MDNANLSEIEAAAAFSSRSGCEVAYKRRVDRGLGHGRPVHPGVRGLRRRSGSGKPPDTPPGPANPFSATARAVKALRGGCVAIGPRFPADFEQGESCKN